MTSPERIPENRVELKTAAAHNKLMDRLPKMVRTTKHVVVVVKLMIAKMDL